MQTFETRSDLQAALAAARKSGHSIGLVPTMGNLHGGHLALVTAAKQQCDFVLTTIFVNPTQFGADEDLDNYPRTLDTDLEQLSASQCDGVFIPSVTEMYPVGIDKQTLITVPGFSEDHCGKSRPGHFDGVCTVVCKFFNLTMPDLAFFGEKDFQQLQVIRKMTADLCLPVTIVGVPTVRTDTGLAMSSRNNYLDPAQLEIAAHLYATLKTTAQRLEAGDKNIGGLEQEAKEQLTTADLKVDYYTVCNASTLLPADRDDKHLVVLAAAFIGRTRLIDNIQVKR